MTIKRGSQHLLGYVVETTYGTTPATPTLKEVPITSFRPTRGYGAARSAQIRQHPFVANMLDGRNTQTFEIGAELQPYNHDDIIANLLGNVWTGTTASGSIKAIDGLVGMTLEDQYPAAFRVDRGCIFNSGEFTFSADQDTPITATFSGMSISASLGNPTSVASGAATAATAYDPFVMGDCTAKINGVAAAVSAATIRFERAVDPYYVLGSRVAKEMVPGAVNVTGSFTLPFEDVSQITPAEAFADASLDIVAASFPGTSSLEFIIPKLKRTTATVQIENRGAIVQQYDFEAYYDTTSATVLTIKRVNPT